MRNTIRAKRKKPPFWWAFIYSVMLVSFTAFVLLKTFVIQSVQVAEVQAGSGASVTAEKTAAVNASVSDQSYKDSNISVKLSQERVKDTTVYIADIQVSSADYLKTAFANNSYGRNIKETTSEMAERNNAILAVNGDYYGFRDDGYVLRNGTLYRSNYGDPDEEAFVLYQDGTCDIIKESQQTAESLLDAGAMQILTFGPGLIENGSMAVQANQEVEQAKNSNPRTAIGMISPLHYIIVVSDGRTEESQGLSLYELAEIMKDQGCTEAYNLDGGGSSVMYFNGKVVNNPTDGRKLGEREVSDIVYIGY
ncbi:phosphodiester glycosidase family protein [Aminipila luticellarii]|uniref:Phosphodiester glycosidase family protein n=2 Tax=Aminipila luticellarii TaxID=2507160 RepID=A0A410PYV2_9FIRM|nr:phosphodiester glycosidase family protein [Aminipila luticellarii]QAT44147.1 phosphodiester glycosidase family protein [Aminipila luticellarii]